jgi:hypothetical protein
MGLLNEADWAAMAADLQAVRDDNPVSIAVRRGGVTLPAQTVRIARMGTVHQRQDSGNIEQSEQRVVVMGDRFNGGDGELYEVDFVRPNRRAFVLAEARMVQ